MEIRFQEEAKQLDAPQSAENAIEIINLLLQDTHYFSHLIVDGVEVHDDPEAYLVQHLDDIKLIEVIAIAVKDFVNDLLLSTEDYLSGAVPQIEHLASGFTAEEQAEQWANLNDLFGGIEWITSMVAVLDHSTARPVKWAQVSEQAKVLADSMPNFEKAVETKDRGQISSLLMKDISEVFGKLNHAVTVIIDQEGKREVLN